MRTIKIGACLILLGLWGAGCEKPGPTNPLAPSDIHDSLLDVNGLANTLSLVHLSAGQVTLNLTGTGAVPNEVHLQGRKVYVVNSTSNTIQVFDADGFTGTSSFIDTGVGCNPWSLIFQDDHTGYCSCLQTNEVLKVNLQGKVVSARKTIPTSIGKYPEGLAVANGKLYTAMTASTGCGLPYSCGDGTQVAVLDLADFAGNSFSNITVDTPNPQALAVDSSNRVHAVCTGDYYSIWGKVDVIDSGSDTVVGSVTGFDYFSPGLIDIASNGKGFVAAWGGAFAYDAAALGSATVMDSNVSHGYLGVSSGNGKVYFSDFANDQIREFDAATLSAGRVFNVGDGPGAAVYVP